MPIEWAGLSPQLLLPLDRSLPEPLRTQLEEGLRQAIRGGRLQPGERLPSSRELAAELGVSRGLVQECYGQLVAEGYLHARGGSATRVASVGTSTEVPAPPPPPQQAPRLIADFAHGVPDLASFPRTDWLWAQREVIRHVPNADLDYGDPRGSLKLREVLTGYLRRVRGSATDPHRIVVCAGFAQGLNIVLHVLAESGVRVVAFEDPGTPRGSRTAARRVGAEAVPVPVDEQGIDVAALAATGARAVIVTPAHQWPTGVVLTPERRHELVAWAQERHAFIIEDDYDAEFRYDREPVGSLQGLAPDRVFSIGTASKSLVPALRLAWIVCPPSAAEAVAGEKGFRDRGSPTLDQLAVATLMESGRYDRHLRRTRITYAERCRALGEAMTEHAPDVALTGLAAGFHAVAHLPDGVDETEVIAAARERSVGLYGMSANRADGSTTPPRLVLGFGNLPERAIRTGIETIADLLRTP
ncbi:PLP-dependent aminotransferase family protein [Actinomadura barringtoniae]|uniref:PLP-dependent aminotransferase family protein n=1 Tax=Actinomadura barringtoniae TaxID=1427535 RepID=A0A939T226_9ACTN|nr:PLP-dependent aminotransferase family protein [Actinomadura barringtoniae]MBO2445823.1 PLP-dependent aminotransferase family protein [Actinomadura barringtoniae]